MNSSTVTGTSLFTSSSTSSCLRVSTSLISRSTSSRSTRRSGGTRTTLLPSYAQSIFLKILFKLARQNYLLSKGRIHRADRQQWLFTAIWRSESDRDEERPEVLGFITAKRQLAVSFFNDACAEHSAISCEYWELKRERNGDV